MDAAEKRLTAFPLGPNNTVWPTPRTNLITMIGPFPVDVLCGTRRWSP